MNLIKKLETTKYCYFRAKLSATSQTAYDNLYFGFLSYKRSIRIPNIAIDEIQDIFQDVLLDNPIIFFVESATYQIVNQQYCNMVTPKYRFDKMKVESTLCAISKKCIEFISGSQNLPELSKEEKVHNYLANTVVYDYAFKSSSFECVGPLLFGRGVCEGISKATKLLLDLLEIPSLIVIGKSIQNFSDGEMHAWNLVQINDCYSHLDVTFDITLMENEIERFDYFNLSDDEISLDHLILTKDVPHCNLSRCYYKTHNLIMYMQKDFYVFLEKQLASNNKDVVFKLPYTQDFEGSKNKVYEMTEKCLKKHCKYFVHYQYSINEKQRVFHLHIL